MVGERTTKQLFYGEHAEGKRYRCNPKKKEFKDGIRTTMWKLETDPNNIKNLLQIELDGRQEYRVE